MLDFVERNETQSTKYTKTVFERLSGLQLTQMKSNYKKALQMERAKTIIDRAATAAATQRETD